jgi:hypothetical protein
MIRRLLFVSLAVLTFSGGDTFAATKPKSAPAPAAATPAPKKAAPPKRSEPVEAFAVPAENGLPQVHAASVIVVDAQNGKVLHEINADQPRPVASTQKLLTALIVAEEGDLDGTVKVEAPDTWAEPSMLYIKPGEIYRRGRSAACAAGEEHERRGAVPGARQRGIGGGVCHENERQGGAIGDEQLPFPEPEWPAHSGPVLHGA